MATVPEALNHALELFRSGRLKESEEICRKVLGLVPNDFNALQLLGAIAQMAGDHHAAVEFCRRAVAVDGKVGAVYNTLGNALSGLGKLDEAVASFQRAVELDPNSHICHTGFGQVLAKVGRRAEAIACYEQAIALNPEVAAPHANLGLLRIAMGENAKAVPSLRRALQLNPQNASITLTLGDTLFHLGEREEALLLYRRAVSLSPQSAVAHNSLGMGFLESERLDEAEDCFRRAVELDPARSELRHNVGNILRRQGRLKEAVGHYRAALDMLPNHPTMHSGYLYSLMQLPGITRDELAAAGDEYERRQGANYRAEWRPHANTRNARRRLKVGFVGRHFGEHATASFLKPLLEHGDRRQFDIHCYNLLGSVETKAKWLRDHAPHWRDAGQLTSREMAEAIRGDGIDILFDLEGHRFGNRLAIFARKPAPIQITRAAHVGSTGLAAVDYLLADRFVIPPKAEAGHSELVLRMPHGRYHYDPPGDAPPVLPLPLWKADAAMFGSFADPEWLSPALLDAWGRILTRLPNSRLVVRHRGLKNARIAARVRDTVAAAGVDAERLDVNGSEPRNPWEALGELDVVLDSHPFSGEQETCQALWMGVPVITCPGEAFVSRHSFSILSSVGLTETVARDLDDYVDIAAKLVGDAARLATLRQGLRERVASSPLCDGPGFAKDFQRLLRKVWRDWCQDAPAKEA